MSMQDRSVSPSHARRSFLARFSSAAAAITAGTSLTSALASTPVQAHDDDFKFGFDAGAFKRANEAYRVRQQAALFQRLQTTGTHSGNGDEQRYPTRFANYTKALPHDALGHVDLDAYRALLTAMKTGDPDDFAAIPLGTPGGVRLANPQAALAFDFVGADSHALNIRRPPTFASAEEAGEMVEVYWQALTRDVSFADYATDPSIATAAASLSSLSDFRGPKIGGAVTSQTIFRGKTPGELNGPYISQFLCKPVTQGPYLQEQKVREALIGTDYMTDYGSWLNVQDGGPAVGKQYNGTNRRYIATGRDLAEYLHRDYSYQAFLNAALLLLPSGAMALADGNPYKAAGNQGGFTTFGPAQILDCVAVVANLGLHAAWCQKWVVHRRLRPEEFGGRVHNKYAAGHAYPIHADLANSGVLAAVSGATGSYLLPMAYPEGSPTHPAYPAGHATIAGACVTVLKAFFKESVTISNPVEADATGTDLLPYAGTLTVGGELNKLAANISLGRDTAGVHWRTDGVEGMNLGEQVAIHFLKDMRRSYNESFAGFSFTKFDGTTVTI